MQRRSEVPEQRFYTTCRESLPTAPAYRAVRDQISEKGERAAYPCSSHLLTQKSMDHARAGGGSCGYLLIIYYNVHVYRRELAGRLGAEQTVLCYLGVHHAERAIHEQVLTSVSHPI